MSFLRSSGSSPSADGGSLAGRPTRTAPPRIPPTCTTTSAAAAGSPVIMEFDAAKLVPSPTASSVLVFLLGVICFAYSLHRDVLLGQIAAPLMTLGAIHGLWRGGFRKVLMIAAFIAMVSLLVSQPFLAGAIVQRLGGAPNGLVSGLITVVAAILAMTILGLLVGRFRTRHIAPRTIPRTIDRTIGTLVGAAEGGLVVLGLCWAATMFRPAAVNIRDHPDTAPNSYPYTVATTLLRLADEAETEPLGRLVRATNLLERSPTIQGMIADLNTTGSIDLNRLDPAMIERINALIPELTKGQYQNLGEMLDARRGGAALPQSSGE